MTYIERKYEYLAGNGHKQIYLVVYKIKAIKWTTILFNQDVNISMAKGISQLPLI